MAFTKCDPSPAAALSRRPDARRHSIIQIRYISTPLKDKWRGTGRKEEFEGGGGGEKREDQGEAIDATANTWRRPCYANDDRYSNQVHLERPDSSTLPSTPLWAAVGGHKEDEYSNPHQGIIIDTIIIN